MAQLYMMQGDASFDLKDYPRAVTAHEHARQYMDHEGVRINLAKARKRLSGGWLSRRFG